MEELPFHTSECVGICLCVCVGREFLIQGFASHRLEAANSVALKICVVVPSGII